MNQPVRYPAPATNVGYYLLLEQLEQIYDALDTLQIYKLPIVVVIVNNNILTATITVWPHVVRKLWGRFVHNILCRYKNCSCHCQRLFLHCSHC